MLLGGDIGGTKVALALFAWDGRRLNRVRSAAFASREHDGLVSMIDAFAADGPLSVEAAAFGVAGPVSAGRAQITNLPWAVSCDELQARLGTPRIRLINDLEATAYGVLSLQPDDVLVLNPGVVTAGSAAVIAAGTGLGEALLWWDGVTHHPMPSEGGHADFAPRGPVQEALLAFLRPRFAHVSYERVCSGHGLVNIYEFLRDTGRADEPASLRARLQHDDPAAEISRAAIADAVPICVQALALFTAIYGAEAGNLALKALAVGGVYVGGGIAPKIRPALADGTFLRAFRDKGRMAALMDKIPVHVILKEQTALDGAGTCAARLARQGGEP